MIKLAKPMIFYIRPEWLDSLREEIPEYADELPIISVSSSTVESVLSDLIAHLQRRRKIGLCGRRFAVEWHLDTAADMRFDQIYRQLLADNLLLLEKV